MPRFYFFDTAANAALALPAFVREGDVILVKGSQAIRTERIVEALLADPADRGALVAKKKNGKKKGEPARCRACGFIPCNLNAFQSVEPIAYSAVISRRENDVEHSYFLAMFCWYLH